jgi:hypothetical protein
MGHSILCRTWQGKGIREGAGERERDWEEREGLGLTGSIVIDEGRRQILRNPARNFTVASR